ncbi:sensor histidine kinase [Marinimicrobium sp. ABcell2]|uniref:sensor histidine kinase n=1 Tax=Marinimicrobium sp. ABcell2 TaxID=3069751 RepID=UPI0027B4AEB3|nr:histidine kinase [Marinimicrobium sp. ABcell2]MDQ2077651.1 histidine kinase [Marinimicrobium sp. ABcell2]
MNNKTDNTLNRQLIQALFWGGWTTLYVLASTLPGYPLKSGFFLIAFTVGVGCWGASETLRAIALKRSWLQRPALQLLPRLGLTLMLLAVGVQVLVFLVLIPSWGLGWVSLPEGGPDYRPSRVLMYWFNTLFMLGVWLASWLVIESRARNRRLEHQRLEDEVQRRVLELDSLRARLNPHFVFNALNNVRALINEDTERAREMVTRLSNTLRYALQHTHEVSVSLEQELAVVEDYLAIEHVHYDERLHVIRRLSATAMSAHLPPMLLQLLVENAIKHGVAHNPQPSELVIIATVEQQALNLTVTNPGTLRQTREGVGLAYLRARLKTWSAHAAFDIHEHQGLVKAKLVLPQERDS